MRLSNALTTLLLAAALLACASARAADPPTDTPTPSPSETASPSASLTPTPSPSASVTASASPTLSPTATPTATPLPSATAVATSAPISAPSRGLQGAFVYPNPARNGSAHIAFHMDKTGTAVLRLFNAAGRPAAEIEEPLPAGDATLPINLLGFARGAFYWKLELRYTDKSHGGPYQGKLAVAR